MSSQGEEALVSQVAAATQAAAVTHTPTCNLVVHNVAKKHNIGTLLRSACAFGVTEVVLIGSNSFNTFGAHGSDAHGKSVTHVRALQMWPLPRLWRCCSRRPPNLALSYLTLDLAPTVVATAVALRHFATLAEAKSYLCDKKGCSLTGVEITPTAKPVHHKPFSGPTAFLMGNEVCASGLPQP